MSKQKAAARGKSTSTKVSRKRNSPDSQHTASSDGVSNNHRKLQASTRNFIPDGAFRKGVRYASVMDQLDNYICRFEEFKKHFLVLDKDGLLGGVGMMHAFIDGQWLEITTSLHDKWRMKKFSQMFATVNVILMLQCFHIIDQRAKELGVDMP